MTAKAAAASTHTHPCWDEEPHGPDGGGEEDEGVEGGYHGLRSALPRRGQQPLQRRGGEEQEPQP